jgi:hypothetical protein
MTQRKTFEEIDQRLRELTSELTKMVAGDPRCAEVEKEISALCLQRHLVRSVISSLVSFMAHIHGEPPFTQIRCHPRFFLRFST